MIVARRYQLAGLVHRVGFRMFTEAAAGHEGICGWVRNLPDGRVEIAAEGDAEALERFDRQVRHGPPRARVDRVDTYDIPPEGWQGFSIR